MGGDGIVQFISQSLYMVPMLLVGLFGIFLFFSLPVPTRVRAFGVAGLALMLVNSLGGALFFSWYTHAMAEGGAQLASMMGFVRLLTSVLHATAVALLVAAAFAGRGVKSPF